MLRHVVVGLIALVLLSGAAAVAWGVSVARAARASHDWPTVPGRILTSRATLTSTRHTRGNWDVDVTYSYTVDGEERTGTDVWVPGAVQGRSTGEIRRVDREMQPGAAVRVHHDPDDPSRACLIPGGEGRGWAIAGIGAAFLVVGGFLAVSVRRRAATGTVPPPPSR